MFFIVGDISRDDLDNKWFSVWEKLSSKVKSSEKIKFGRAYEIDFSVYNLFRIFMKDGNILEYIFKKKKEGYYMPILVDVGIYWRLLKWIYNPLLLSNTKYNIEFICETAIPFVCFLKII